MRQLELDLLDERDPKRIEVRLVHLSEAHRYEQDSEAARGLRDEYQRLHTRWMRLRRFTEIDFARRRRAPDPRRSVLWPTVS